MSLAGRYAKVWGIDSVEEEKEKVHVVLWMQYGSRALLSCTRISGEEGRGEW